MNRRLVSTTTLLRQYHHQQYHGNSRKNFTSHYKKQLVSLLGSSSSSSSSRISNHSPHLNRSHPNVFLWSQQYHQYSTRFFSSSDCENFRNDVLLNSPRENMPFDVLIVGGGPSGLSASIRLKQLCQENDVDLSICVIEKGSEIGAHILSGNVFDPKAISELLPSTDWKSELLEQQSSHATPVRHDEFLFLTENKSYRIPSMILPKQLHNDGNYVISLGQLCRYLGTKAEEMGVEIYPGFAASEVLYNGDKSAVKGVATRDMGIDKSGKPKDTFERGVELYAKQTIFAEGARGSCSEELIKLFGLRAGKSEQTYGLGIKEVWEIPPEKMKAGFVQHTLGFPLQKKWNDKTFGGTFLYHQEPNLVHAGLVIGLDYENPYINPYKEFQRWKEHPDIRTHFEGGTCISYGARVLNEGGLNAIPKLTFKGGCLIGCSAGFLNSVKIKGSHTAIKSGQLAAEAVFETLGEKGHVSEGGVQQKQVEEEDNNDDDVIPAEAMTFEDKIQSSWIYRELYEVRNTHEAFARWGFLPGLFYTGLAAHISKGKEPWTLKHTTRDADTTQEAKNFEPIHYKPPDGVLTFDLLTNLQRSGTYHEDDQLCHLKVKPELHHIPETVSMQKYAAPEQRFCPAGVYEYITEKGSEQPKLVINAQNCVHCKCCSIKMPGEYIHWTVPEGGGGPNYQVM